MIRRIIPDILIFLAGAALVFGAVALCTVPARGQTTQPTTRPAFFVAAWQVPADDVPKWQARGVTTFMAHVDHGGAMTKAEWERRVALAGGRFITYPGSDVASEALQPNRIGFLQLDEPDLSSHVDKPGNTPAELAAVYARTKATGLPMYLTVGAMDNEWYDGLPKPQKTDGSKYGHRASAGGWLAHADVVGFDFYLARVNRFTAIRVWDRLFDRAYEWSGRKPVYVFVETCTDGQTFPFTADQFEQEVWYAVDYCKLRGIPLAGIVYFSHTFDPNTRAWKSFDGTSPAVAERMTAVNAELRRRFLPQPPTSQPSEAPDLTALKRQLSDVQTLCRKQANSLFSVFSQEFEHRSNELVGMEMAKGKQIPRQ